MAVHFEHERIRELEIGIGPLALLDEVRATDAIEAEREEALQTLSYLEDYRSIPPLTAMVEDGQQPESLRECASEVLCGFDDTTTAERRRAWWATGDPVVMAHALRMMERSEADIVVRVASDDEHPLQALASPRCSHHDSRDWDADPWVRGWVEGLESLLGSRRWVVSETQVSSTLTRFHLERERGTAVATIILDDDGRWFGASLKRRPAEGIANIVLQCPWNEDRAAMATLYGERLRGHRRPPVLPVSRRGGKARPVATRDRRSQPDTLREFYERLLGPDTTPVLAFQHSDAEPPRWPDPAYPAHVHVDLAFDDPAPVAERVIELGGSVLRRRDGFPVYADPAGHPFCLGRPGE